MTSISPTIGQIVTGEAVEVAMLDTLQTWLQTYIAEIERQTGRDPESIPMIRSWSTSTQFDAQSEDQLPRVMLIATGMSGEPQRDGSGSYDARWGVAVGVIASASTQSATNALAKLYAAAIRTAVVQHRSLGGFALGTEWLDERYDDLTTDGIRTLAGARLVFEVEVADIVRSNGPRDVPEDPYEAPADLVEIESADATVTLEAL